MPVDPKLIDSIRELGEKGLRIEELNTADADRLFTQLKECYSINENYVWWWESAGNTGTSVRYNEQDISAILQEHLPGAGTCYWVITDDEPDPWPVFRGTLTEITHAIYELRFFEYFIVSEDLSKLVFDTHHNALVFWDAEKDSRKSTGPRLTRFWIEFERTEGESNCVEMAFGVGVTAYTSEDAYSLLTRAFQQGDLFSGRSQIPEIKRTVPQVDAQGMIAPACDRGIWFPQVESLH